MQDIKIVSYASKWSLLAFRRGYASCCQTGLITQMLNELNGLFPC